ncbi:hypothetical protein F0562_031369 [Nyssa sinensis]|uniref:Pentacotripeptide-repeat region of PRORP domain-containing protein n=1 Tax=Nyssa sinensis TaxID=561372 RepID=A0A5J5AVQ4_9ASTE|nr:hypothetical protein F0562_031369 [Nyssa sinensis]
MIKKRSNSDYLFFFIRTRKAFSTCPLPIDPPSPTVSAATNGHKAFCFSLTEQLVRRGLLSLAQRVIQRIISQCSSVPDAISAFDFAVARGMELDSCSYGVLIRKLVSSGETRMAEVLYNDKLIRRGHESDPSILNSMVICHCKLGQLEEAKNHFDRLIVMKSIPCKYACNTLLRELCAQDRVLEAFDYFSRMNDAGIFLGFWPYKMLIDGLCFRGCLDEALHLFDIMCDRGVPPNVHLWKSLVHGFCKRGRVEEAELLSLEMESQGWVLHDQMVESGIEPDVVTYNIMICQYCKEHKVDCALILLNNMSRCNIAPTVHCYTVLIATLHKENRMMEVDELYNKMLDSGVVPDHVLFFTLVKKSPKGHELRLAFTILQAVAKNGYSIDPSSFPTSAESNPTSDLELKIDRLLGEILRRNSYLADVAFSIYIIALCTGGKTDVALLCMDKMVSLGCRPLLSTYNSVLKCLCQEGLFEAAKSLINLMQDRGMVPNSTSYLIMVNEHGKRGDLASAFDVLDQLDKRGLKPSVAIYDSIIGFLGGQKRIFEAEDMFKRMLEAGVDPDEVVYVTMINAYSKNGRAIKAFQLFDKMITDGIRPSSHAYTALINGLVKKNMTEKGCLYLDRMLEDGFMPNHVLYTALINQFLRKRELEFAFRLLDLMENSQIECDLITYITLVSGVCRNIKCIKGRWHVARTKSERAREMLFHLLHQKSLVPRENSLRISINSLKEIKYFALKLIQEVKDTRFMPNLYLYNGMMSGFCLAYQMQHAYDHLELMRREGVAPNQVTFTILIDGHIRFRETDYAIGLFNKMNASGCAPDRIVYNTLIKGLCKGGRLLDALSLSHTMHKRGFSPWKASYESLLSCLCASRLSIHALRLCEDMLAHDYCNTSRDWSSWIFAKNQVHMANPYEEVSEENEAYGSFLFGCQRGPLCATDNRELFWLKCLSDSISVSVPAN